MILQLTEDRRIGSNASGFNLQRQKRTKKGLTWQQYRWYPTLEMTLSHVPEQLLRESDANGTTEILATLRSFEQRIMKSFGVDNHE